jgi:hypothetical protein
MLMAYLVTKRSTGTPVISDRRTAKGNEGWRRPFMMSFRVEGAMPNSPASHVCVCSTLSKNLSTSRRVVTRFAMCVFTHNANSNASVLFAVGVFICRSL